MHFARVLRAAGMPVGTDRIQLALQALSIAGLETKADFRATLAACFIARAEQRTLFDQAFDLFWRDPDLAGRMMAMLLPKVQAQQGLLTPLTTARNPPLPPRPFPGTPPPAQRRSQPGKTG